MQRLTTTVENVIQKTAYSIQEIESSINIWRKVEQSELTLGANVKVLADVYGLMIYRGWTSVAISQLSKIQLHVLIQSSLNWIVFSSYIYYHSINNRRL
jgi:hypothetical protein